MAQAGGRRGFRNLPGGYISKTTGIVLSAGFGLFGSYQTWKGNERFYSEILMPAVHKCFQPETAHRIAIALASRNLVPKGRNGVEFPELRTSVWDFEFRNPIGLAAGFDKDGEAVEGLMRLGFGFLEVGTVTPLPQPGNPQPRVFRLVEDRALINRFGFNSAGHGALRSRLQRLPLLRDTVLGVNVGVNKDSVDPVLDYSIGISLLGHHADYLVINVSSPNTPGLRQLQQRQELEKILKSAAGARQRLLGFKIPKLLVKVSPDLSAPERKAVAEVCLNPRFGVDGIIVSNTTISRPSDLQSSCKTKGGGLSGAPLRKLSTECIRDFYQLTGGGLPIIGVGGIANGDDAYEKIRAGASLLQIYTSLVYQGFPVVGKIKRELAERLSQDGFTHISDAVGKDSIK